MKGFLHKTEQGWVVEYAKHSELPLHLDDESLWMFAELNEEWKDKLDGKEVEFEIVSDTYEKPGKGNTYAKLIPSKEQQKQLITEIMDLDAKDELYEDVKPKIDLQPMTQEEMNEIRNTAYKYFDIDDTVNDTVNDTVKITIKKDSEAAKVFESLRREKKEFKKSVESGKIMPQHIREKIDKLTGELKKVYELAEQSWEGCDGCDENDKNFWMNGFQKGYYIGKPDHLSDEEIEKAMEKHINNDLDLYESLVDGHISYNTGIDLLNNLFIAGAKWYREQLKTK